MSAYYPRSKRAPESYKTEFDVLKASHKFLRSADEDITKSWDAQLAKKYEDSLFKEFAVCDLKHYKSGNIALRWRTEDEVLSGAGEETCGNTRCPYHNAPSCSESAPDNSRNKIHGPPKPTKLTTMELPFSYTDQGETEPQQAMVKVVLCEGCVKKLMWKREKDKKQYLERAEQPLPGTSTGKPQGGPIIVTDEADNRGTKFHKYVRNRRRSDDKNSRSRSPRRRRKQS